MCRVFRTIVRSRAAQCGASLSTPVEPLRLLLLADEPAWAALLRECLAPMGDGAVLISAPNWESVSNLFDDDHSAVLLTTANLQPGPGRCSLPTVLLLEEEPLVSPLGVSDWLILNALDELVGGVI
eukprot:gene1754-2025_t